MGPQLSLPISHRLQTAVSITDSYTCSYGAHVSSQTIVGTCVGNESSLRRNCNKTTIDPAILTKQGYDFIGEC